MQSAAAPKLEPVDRSGALRAQLLAETPSWYSPWVHLAIPSLTGLAAITLALSQLSGVSLLTLAVVPAVTYAICNAIEWWAHKYLLHHRNPLAPVLYDQHTPKHHMVYTHEDMAIRDIREFRMVLIPAYGVFLIVLGQLPILLAATKLGYVNAGLLWVATATAYAVGYEWLHLSYHLDPESRIGRLSLIRWLRRQHTIHHDPQLMQAWNFNVTVPLFDYILGTQTDGRRYKILRVQLRSGALTNFDPARIKTAYLKAARSIGGFGSSHEPGVNEHMLEGRSDPQVAEVLADMVVMSLNADPRHHIPNYPPHIEQVQDVMIHVLRSYAFTDVADVYETYRWGKHWIRQGDLTTEQFVGNGTPDAKTKLILRTNTEWGCDTVAGLNELVSSGRGGELIDRSISEYEAELDRAVQAFERRIAKGDRIRLVIVAGPSSSGKTTTTVKLHQRLTARGVPLVMMNLDNYFWPAHQHPVDWMADRDYETPHALDYNLINRHLHELLEGKEVHMPRYDFKLGDRVPGEKLKLPKDACLLLDCLHGLYPPLTQGIAEEAKFRCYLENMNMIYEGLGSTSGTVRFTDVRMLRRMLRDHAHRNHSPLLTLVHWEKVRKSELGNIIPLWAKADVLVNGGTAVDLPLLKPFVEDIFPEEAALGRFPGHLDARLRRERVRRLLASTVALPRQLIEKIPGDALVREFIGGSTLSIPHND